MGIRAKRVRETGKGGERNMKRERKRKVNKFSKTSA